MTIIKHIEVDDASAKKVAEDLQEEIRKIETEENAHFIAFVSMGEGTRHNPKAQHFCEAEIITKNFIVAFSKSNYVNA